jgi:hypothetical protein
MNIPSPDSEQPRRKKYVPVIVVEDLVLDNCSRTITPRTPEQQRFAEETRAQHRRWIAEREQAEQQARDESAEPHPDASDDSSDSAPTSGS